MIICISLNAMLERNKEYVRDTGSYIDNHYDKDYSLALISAIGDVDEWRKKRGLAPSYYLVLLRRYWDKHKRLPNFFFIDSSDEDDLDEFVEIRVASLVEEYEMKVKKIEDKYRWTEEKPTFDVIVKDVASDKRVAVVKVIRKLTSLGLADAKAFTTDLPKALKEGVSKEKADEAKTALEEAGAKVSLKFTENGKKLS